MQMVWHYDKVVEPEFPGRYCRSEARRSSPWHSVPTATGRGLGWSWWWRRTYALNSGCCPEEHGVQVLPSPGAKADRKSTRLNSSHLGISYAVFCLKKKNRLTRAALCMGPTHSDACPSPRCGTP